jgi:hypothetical protein
VHAVHVSCCCCCCCCLQTLSTAVKQAHLSPACSNL